MIVILEIVCTGNYLQIIQKIIMKILVNIIRQLHSKVKNDSHLNERARYRKFARSFFYLLLSIGGTHVIFDIILHSTDLLENTKIVTIMFHCIYVIINSLWVCFVKIVIILNIIFRVLLFHIFIVSIVLKLDQKCGKG